MRRLFRSTLVGVLVGGATVVACGIDTSKHGCRTDGDCLSGRECQQGICVARGSCHGDCGGHGGLAASEEDGGAAGATAGASPNQSASGGTAGRVGSGASGSGANTGKSGAGGESNGTGASVGNSHQGGGAPAASESGNGGEVSQGGAGTGGDGGAGTAGGSPVVPTPGMSGVVSLLIGGKPVCGGTLITNAWVLTADQCVPAGTPPGAVTVGFGADSRAFQQTREVTELQRFPGNDGTSESRGRDVLLLGVNAPFVLDGDTQGYQHPTMPWATMTPAQTCVGWDLVADPASPEHLLHEETLSPFHLDLGAKDGTRELGDVLTFLNTDFLDKRRGLLPMPADVGTGCFVPFGDADFISAVQTGNAPLRLDGTTNQLDEASALSLGEPALRNWLDSVLFGVETLPAHFASPVVACSFAPDSFEAFGIEPDGNVSWHHFASGPARTWTEQELLAPPEQTELAAAKPGVVCRRDGSAELFARGIDGTVWWKRRSNDGLWSGWSLVEDATTEVTSGVTVVEIVPEHFHLFGVSADTVLRHAEYDHGWLHLWEDWGWPYVGTPAVQMDVEGSLVVYSANADGWIWELPYWSGQTHGWYHLVEAHPTNVTVASWSANRRDLLGSSGGALFRSWYSLNWLDSVIDSGIPMPEGEPSAISTRVGSIDVLVTKPNGNVWHAFWPRSPEAADIR